VIWVLDDQSSLKKNGDFYLKKSGARAVLLIVAFIIYGALMSFFSC